MRFALLLRRFDERRLPPRPRLRARFLPLLFFRRFFGLAGLKWITTFFGRRARERLRDLRRDFTKRPPRPRFTERRFFRAMWLLLLLRLLRRFFEALLR